MVDKLEPLLTRLIVDDMKRQARVSNSEVRYDIECGVMDFDGAFRPCEIAHRIAATLSTPTQDARSRGKVLEEALCDLVSWFPESGPTSYGPWIIEAGEWGADDAVAAARTALGNKETDRHG